MSSVSEHFGSLANFGLQLISDEKSNEANNIDSVSLYFTKFPAGASLKSIEHLAQIVQHRKFIKYDYDIIANYHIYGQAEPKEFDLKNINKNIKILLIGGEEDRLANKNDVEWLYNEIKNNVILYKIIPLMGHISFISGKTFDWFDEILAIILKEK